MSQTRQSLIPSERIEHSILLIRGQRVMLSGDLAKLYGVATGQLVRSVKRNLHRFPEDFAFQLSDEEFANLKCQFGISSSWGGARTPPFAFTEHGIAMLSSILNSERAIAVNIEIMRTFVRLRQWLTSNKDLAKRLDDLEMKYDRQFKSVFDAIRQLMSPPTATPKKGRIGFRGPHEESEAKVDSTESNKRGQPTVGRKAGRRLRVS